MHKDKKAVKQFLRKHKCLNKFKRNLARIGKNNWFNLPFYGCSEVAAGFDWCISNEGHKYWSIINAQWLASRGY